MGGDTERYVNITSDQFSIYSILGNNYYNIVECVNTFEQNDFVLDLVIQ